MHCHAICVRCIAFFARPRHSTTAAGLLCRSGGLVLVRCNLCSDRATSAKLAPILLSFSISALMHTHSHLFIYFRSEFTSLFSIHFISSIALRLLMILLLIWDFCSLSLSLSSQTRKFTFSAALSPPLSLFFRHLQTRNCCKIKAEKYISIEFRALSDWRAKLDLNVYTVHFSICVCTFGYTFITLRARILCVWRKIKEEEIDF